MSDCSLKQNILRIGKNTVSRLLGYRVINKMFNNIICEYDGSKSDYVVSTWPIYDFDKEIQLRKNIENYIDVDFESINVMIFENYDEILKTTFGNYMELPPKSDRHPKHGSKMWWRDE